MTEASDPDRKRAEAEALDWIVALQEAPEDRQVRRRFRQWLAAAPANARAWDESARVYAGIGETSPVHSEHWARSRERHDAVPIRSISGAFRRQSPPGPRSDVRRAGGRVRRPIAAALSAAAAALVIAVALPEATVRWQADAIAGTGEVRTMTLADGSHISLSPGSAVSIDYSAADRRIGLIRGQAWFDVQDDPRPFHVVARNVETTDIGTAFEVGLTDGAIRVAVGHGIVRVDDAGTGRTISERLFAGQTVSIDPTGKAVQGSAPPELIGAWRDGRLAVQDRPVSEVVDALRPWYRGMILVRPGVLAGRRVTGIYDLRDTAGAMAALTRAHGGRVTQVTPWLLILSDD